MFSAAVRKASTALVRVPARSLHIEQRGIPGEVRSTIQTN